MPAASVAKTWRTAALAALFVGALHVGHAHVVLVPVAQASIGDVEAEFPGAAVYNLAAPIAPGTVNPLELLRSALLLDTGAQSADTESAIAEPLTREVLLRGADGFTILHAVRAAGGQATVLYDEIPTAMLFASMREQASKAFYKPWAQRSDAIRVNATGGRGCAAACGAEGASAVSEVSLGADGSDVGSSTPPVMVVAQPKLFSEYVGDATDAAPGHPMSAMRGFLRDATEVATTMSRRDGVPVVLALLYQDASSGRPRVALRVQTATGSGVEQGTSGGADDAVASPLETSNASPLAPRCFSSLLLQLSVAASSLVSTPPPPAGCEGSAWQAVFDRLDLAAAHGRQMAQGGNGSGVAAPTPMPVEDPHAAFQRRLQGANTRGIAELTPIQSHVLTIACGLGGSGTLAKADATLLEDGVDRELEGAMTARLVMARWMAWDPETDGRRYTPPVMSPKEAFIALMKQRKAELAARKEAEAAAAPAGQGGIELASGARQPATGSAPLDLQHSPNRPEGSNGQAHHDDKVAALAASIDDTDLADGAAVKRLMKKSGWTAEP